MVKSRPKAKKGIVSFNVEEVNKKRDLSPRIVSWFPVTQAQRDAFIRLSINGGWVGIGLLVVFWIVVRIVGPAAGWWIPADAR